MAEVHRNDGFDPQKDQVPRRFREKERQIAVILQSCANNDFLIKIDIIRLTVGPYEIGGIGVYNIFISHSWGYSDAYVKLVSLLDGASYFSYRNYSVPKDDPLRIRNTAYYRIELRNKIKNQMSCCSVVLVMAGVYASYSDSIDMEISVAKELGKPIIAIEPWASERTSAVVKNAATRIVGWNTNSIVAAIREVTK